MQEQCKQLYPGLSMTKLLNKSMSDVVKNYFEEMNKLNEKEIKPKLNKRIIHG
jgi:hypothetical protein